MASKFSDLRNALPSAAILEPGNEGYEASLFRWSASCIKPTAVVVQPNNASEASIALRYAVENNIFPLAFRGGGHSTSGDSSSDSGMVIDLARMRATSVDPEAQTITFGGGCTWEDVNGALWEHRLATVSGTVGDTGVAGLILGGGYGYLTGQCGLALDCLLSCEVVLANGDIVKASKDENADLFWALCGAGTNLGIVTTFTSQAFPQGDSWAGFLGFAAKKETLEKIVEFGNEFKWAARRGRDVIKPLIDLNPVVNTTNVLSYTELNLMFNKQPRGPKDRHLFGGANFTLPLDLADAWDLCSFFWDTTGKPENTNFRHSSIGFKFHPTQKIRQVGLEETAYANRGQYCSICTTVNWTDRELDSEARKLSKMIARYIGDKVGYKGSATRAEKVYGPNAARLRELKLKYNPDCLFRKIIDLSKDSSQ
ncbi:FAD-binding domain-containing protein [Saccharata proteae CBS 121410]|uniref:FAD-binding domain-containing protein n=1 Tax=Saccharata proteae CBS 121410 TaxID=1314787 RepID=A0A9P4HLW6_9PEZI|nr:FAD-binding domain-containing protein [Saccharata proteae CBS 121410]